MDESNNTERRQPGKFWHGLVISLAGWILDAGIATLVYSLVIFNIGRGWEHFWEEFQHFALAAWPIFIVLGFIWIPVAAIVGFRSSKFSIKASLSLGAITFIIAPLLVGCGFGILVSL